MHSYTLLVFKRLLRHTKRLKKNTNIQQTFIAFSCDIRAPSQYLKRRLSVRSRQVSKPRDLYLELSDRSEIWQALRQQCCRCASQISKRYDNLKYQSRGFETLRDLTKRRLFGYWDGALHANRDRVHQSGNWELGHAYSDMAWESWGGGY